MQHYMCQEVFLVALPQDVLVKEHMNTNQTTHPNWMYQLALMSFYELSKLNDYYVVM